MGYPNLLKRLDCINAFPRFWAATQNKVKARNKSSEKQIKFCLIVLNNILILLQLQIVIAHGKSENELECPIYYTRYIKHSIIERRSIYRRTIKMNG